MFGGMLKKKKSMARKKIDELVFPDGQRVAIWADPADAPEGSIRFILDKEIPRPWSEWFFRGFLGACLALEDGCCGIYAHDVVSFIKLWQADRWIMWKK